MGVLYVCLYLCSNLITLVNCTYLPRLDFVTVSPHADSLSLFFRIDISLLHILFFSQFIRISFFKTLDSLTDPVWWL